MDWREARIGAHVGPGWIPIVDGVWAKMQEIDPDIEATQVKEKFGGLRLYFTTLHSVPLDRALMEMLRIAETECLRTCEICGAPGELRKDRSWLKTLCDPHHEDGRPVPTILFEMENNHG